MLYGYIFSLGFEESPDYDKIKTLLSNTGIEGSNIEGHMISSVSTNDEDYEDKSISDEWGDTKCNLTL